MSVYYNEFDPYTAEWLRRLIKAGELPAGDVDERDIRNISPDDLKPYTQCHFFAGIGGWPLALRQAGWSEDRPVWTGSCPCQPFSVTGKKQGFKDERHLWPIWFDLIKVCKPDAIFGEQVASKTALEWLDLVWTDLEDAGYTVGAADLCAAGVTAPHIRQRLWFGASLSGLADTNRACGQGGMSELGQISADEKEGTTARPRRSDTLDPAVWENIQWLDCRDNVKRPYQPSTLPLAHGLPGDLGRLRAYGNAIVPQVATEFITAFEHTMTGADHSKTPLS